MDEIINLVNNHKYEDALLAINQEILKEEGNSFYELLMLKCTVMIKLGKYQEVLDILDDELSMPYIPMEVEDELHTIYDFAVSMLYQDEIVHKPFTDDELIDHLLNSKDSSMIMSALQQLFDKNIRKYLDDLKSFLADSKKNPLYQSMVLEIMLEQEINTLVRVSKNKNEIDVIPSELTPVLESSFVLYTTAYLDEMIFKEPSLLKIAKELLHTFAYVIYPDTLEVDFLLVAAGLHALAMNYQGQVIDMGVLSLLYNFGADEIEEMMIEIEQHVQHAIPRY